jgi:hypothetical protein
MRSRCNACLPEDRHSLLPRAVRETCKRIFMHAGAHRSQSRQWEQNAKFSLPRGTGPEPHADHSTSPEVKHE